MYHVPSSNAKHFSRLPTTTNLHHRPPNHITPLTPLTRPRSIALHLILLFYILESLAIPLDLACYRVSLGHQCPPRAVTPTSMTTKNNLGPHLNWLRQVKPQIPPPRAKPGNALLPPVATPASPAPAPVQQLPSRRPPTTAPEREIDKVFAPPPVPPARERERRRGGGEEYEIQEDMPVLQLESSVSTRRPKLTSRLKGTTPQQQQATPKATMEQDDRSYETPVPRTAVRRENLTGGGYPTPATSSNSTPSTPLISTETLTNFEPPRQLDQNPSFHSCPLHFSSKALHSRHNGCRHDRPHLR